MRLGKVIQSVYQRHGVPTHRSSPKVGRVPRIRIGPALLSRFIPTVIEQTRLRIARVTLDQNELFGDVVKIAVFMKHRGVLGIEGLSHIETVQPHLRRIYFLMPETAFRSARV